MLKLANRTCTIESFASKYVPIDGYKDIVKENYITASVGDIEDSEIRESANPRVMQTPSPKPLLNRKP